MNSYRRCVQFLAAAALAVLLALALHATHVHAADPPISPSIPPTLTLANLRPAPTTTGAIKPSLPNPKRRPGQAPLIAGGPVYGPSYYYVQPAIHLVWGMATVDPQPDNSHLGYLTEAEVMPYIEEGIKAGVAVILDSQIANLSPTAAISPALPYLKYPNVHLAIDPEFAVVHRGQYVPGNPIGYITAGQVNDVQAAIAGYMRARGIQGKRILMVHQFQFNMILDKEQLDARFPEVELTLSVDGFGSPYVKTSKYNALVDAATPFTSFKLFYNWDEPLMTPRQALGVDGTEHTDFIEITPNMIQYQ